MTQHNFNQSLLDLFKLMLQLISVSSAGEDTNGMANKAMLKAVEDLERFQPRDYGNED